MKKYAIVVMLAAMLVGFNQISQAQGFKEGGIDLNLGLGFTSSNGFIPVFFGGNYMIKDFLSVGAEMQFRIDNANQGWYGNEYNYHRNGFAFITRGDYHFNKLLKLPEAFDVYAGIDLGVAFYGDYKSKDTPYPWDDSDNFYFLGGPHAGGHWMFADKFGLNAEFGGRSGDGAYMKVGFTFLVK
jgi:outer membrane immunogenic protein